MLQIVTLVVHHTKHHSLPGTGLLRWFFARQLRFGGTVLPRFHLPI